METQLDRACRVGYLVPPAGEDLINSSESKTHSVRLTTCTIRSTVVCVRPCECSSSSSSTCGRSHSIINNDKQRGFVSLFPVLHDRPHCVQRVRGLGGCQSNWVSQQGAPRSSEAEGGGGLKCFIVMIPRHRIIASCWWRCGCLTCNTEEMSEERA